MPEKLTDEEKEKIVKESWQDTFPPGTRIEVRVGKKTIIKKGGGKR